MSTCFVKSCKSSCYVRKKENLVQNAIKHHFFSPTPTKIIDEWKKVIPDGERFSKQHRLCELHFQPEDVLTEFVTKMPDGTEHRFKRGRASLRQGAMPTIFPKIDFENVKEEKNTKLQKEMKKIIVKARDSFLSVNGKETDFEKIVSLANNIPLPSMHWFVNSLKNFIQWTSWSENPYESVKRVIVFEDKTVVVMIGERQIVLDNYQKCGNISDIVDLLKEVDTITPCAETERDKKCLGFVRQKERGRKIQFCPECLKKRKRIKKLVIPLSTKLRERIKVWKEKYKNEARRVKRLLRNKQIMKNIIRELKTNCGASSRKMLTGSVKKSSNFLVLKKNNWLVDQGREKIQKRQRRQSF